MAKILAFPPQRPRLRLIVCESHEYLNGQINATAVALHQATETMLDAAKILDTGVQPVLNHSIYTGEALENALTAIVALINIRSRNTDRPLLHAALDWFATFQPSSEADRSVVPEEL